MSTTPYFAAAGQVSYTREGDAPGSLAQHPAFFTPRKGDVELSLQAENGDAHRRLDEAHLAAQAQSQQRWTDLMRGIHNEAHSRIDTERSVKVAAIAPLHTVPCPPAYRVM